MKETPNMSLALHVKRMEASQHVIHFACHCGLTEDISLVGGP